MPLGFVLKSWEDETVGRKEVVRKLIRIRRRLL